MLSMTQFVLDLVSSKVYCLVRAYLDKPFIYKGLYEFKLAVIHNKIASLECGFTDRNTILTTGKLEESA